MKQLILISFLTLSLNGYSQLFGESNHKGELFGYWGWNWSWYSNSDIHFKGENYDFTLNNVVAKDRQTPFSVNEYLNPKNITIPQYNFRIGYYLTKNKSLSIGIDHMKYVVQHGQAVSINGSINLPESPYNGNYYNEEVTIKSKFLQLEHTDGLNYANIEYRQLQEIWKSKHLSINGILGLGAGALIPKTDATVLNQPRHDKFHLSGYGINGVAGLNLVLFNHLCLQTEIKEGYINLPDILITHNSNDRAKQHFFFTQFNFTLGFVFDFIKKE